MLDSLPSTSPSIDMPPLSTPGLDPFLSGTTVNSNDYHSRQESADSGLGMGNTYSLPHTPEGFLSPMDDGTMETTNDGEWGKLRRKGVSVRRERVNIAISKYVFASQRR